MKKIYVYLISTQFRTGKAIRVLTGNTYNHVAISFKPDTKLLYSYARYRYREPLSAGFGIEYTDRYYGIDEMADIKVYEYEVTDDHYNRIIKNLGYYIENQKSTKYNYLDILGYPFKKHLKLGLTHTCLSFALELLEINDVFTIGQFEKALSKNKVLYEGPLDRFESTPTSGDIDFFENRGGTRIFAAAARSLGILLERAMKKLVFAIIY